MPKILKTNEQEIALQKITDNLKQIQAYNALINSDGQFTMTFQCKKQKMTFDVDQKYVEGYVKPFRKALVTEVKTLSKKYAIGLDDSDESILENADGKKVKEIDTPEPATEVDEPVTEEPAEEAPEMTDDELLAEMEREEAEKAGRIDY